MWTVTIEDIEVRMKLYIQEKQMTFVQGQEILVLLAKNLLGTSSKSDDTISENFKNLPVLNDVNQVSAWFKRNKQNG